jgi:hypothetical protein
MANRFRNEIEGLEQDVTPEQQKAELPKNMLTNFFVDGVLSKEAATSMLPFILFLALLCMVYIGNKHLAEKNVRSIDKLTREVKELSWDYKTFKADLMLKSTQSEVAKQVDTLGLKELLEPPQKIILISEK